MTLEKFTPPLIDFIDKYFDISRHKFTFITSKKYLYGLTENHDVEFLHSDEDFSVLRDYMKQSDKIILHGLWRDKVDAILFESPQLLKKSYWIMWGGDFYFPETISDTRKEVIKNMGYLITHVTGDVELARRLYGATGQYRQSLSYPSNLYQETSIAAPRIDQINILVGNSGDPSNNHLEVFEKLRPFLEMNIKIHTPLSYGNSKYSHTIIKAGTEIFGEKYQALTSHLPHQDYVDFLNSIDIAIFNHQRQQAMGNIVTLLGLGKKVYMRRNVSLRNTLTEMGLKIYDAEKLELTAIPEKTKLDNQSLIREKFSVAALINQLNTIFEETP